MNSYMNSWYQHAQVNVWKNNFAAHHFFGFQNHFFFASWRSLQPPFFGLKSFFRWFFGNGTAMIARKKHMSLAFRGPLDTMSWHFNRHVNIRNSQMLQWPAAVTWKNFHARLGALTPLYNHSKWDCIFWPIPPIPYNTHAGWWFQNVSKTYYNDIFLILGGIFRKNERDS